VWHALILVFAWAGTLLSGMAVLVLVGLAQGLCIVPMSILQLRNAEPAMRGRIMGLRTLAVYGLPVGLLVAGALIEQVGFRAVAVLYGGLGLLGAALILLRWHAHLWTSEASANSR
jgi:predicted MFS family arabinose efflux permease